MNVAILGAGVTGLAAGKVSGFPVYEADAVPGGLCASYALVPGDPVRSSDNPKNANAYRFQTGGGHWIWAEDRSILDFIGAAAPSRKYQRRSSVYFSEENKFVPYPLQNNLRYLEKTVARKILEEIRLSGSGGALTLAEWLETVFGSTLNKLFFRPFHERYTAGLFGRVAPQDQFKTPVDPEQVQRGAVEEGPVSGYNPEFIYPVDGLSDLAMRLAGTCTVHYGKKAVAVDLPGKEILFSDGTKVRFDALISTLPLNVMTRLAGITEQDEDLYTSVLVLNIGAIRGKSCPEDHWLYVPDSRSKFYRIGFYSNVDPDFLPSGGGNSDDRVSLYVERAYSGGARPSPDETGEYTAAVVEELTQWGFISQVEITDPSWIDIAYTWRLPGSHWREKVLGILEENRIFMAGHFARGGSLGIANSIRQGMAAGIKLKQEGPGF